MVPGRPRRRSLIQAAAAALGALLPAPAAEAREISPDELHRLTHGEVVKVPLDLELPGGDYFGGVSYAVLQSPAAEVMAVLLDPASYTHILPLTLESRVLGATGGDTQVFFKQGGKLGSASYVLVVRRESPGLLRFWMDPSEPHEIGDCWGYFRVQPWGRRGSLLTYAAVVHLEPGLVKMLFKETIRRYSMGTPGLVRAYVRERQLRAGRHPEG
jgi:hypothetical protein